MRTRAAWRADARSTFISPESVRWLRRALAERRHGLPCTSMNACWTLTSTKCT